MRLTSFSGLTPKLPDQHLGPVAASRAINLDFHDETQLLPWPAPAPADVVVDVNGMPFVGDPVTLYCASGVWVGFPIHTEVCLDFRARGGAGSFLFVQGGALWRSSAAWVLDKHGPELVGMQPPVTAPSVAISVGGNPAYPKFPDASCGTLDPNSPDCNDLVPPESRTYVMTYVNCMGEESVPSPPAEPVDTHIQDAVLLLDTNTPPSNAVTRRYYRSVTGTKGVVSMLFVAEQPIATAGFTDTIPALSLGDELETSDHYPPPSCLSGVAVVGDNITVVWGTRSLWMSVGMLPHAYPPTGKFSVPYDIVKVTGTPAMDGGPGEFMFFILTSGKPFRMGKNTAGIPSPRPFDIDEPCLSPKGVANVEGAVAYCSPNGVILLTSREPKAVLDGVMTEREWKYWGSRDTQLVFHRGLLFGFSGLRSWVLPVSSYLKARAANLSEVALHPTAAYADAEYGLHLALPASGAVARLVEWGAGAGLMTAVWKSRVFVMPGWWEPGAMKISADFPEESKKLREGRVLIAAWRRENGDNTLHEFFTQHPEYKKEEPELRAHECPIRVKVFNTGHLYFERGVRSSLPFRLPHKRYGVEWAVEITTRVPIREVHMDVAINDLVQLGGGVGNSV